MDKISAVDYMETTDSRLRTMDCVADSESENNEDTA